MSKAILFAGVSRLNGELKFRTAANPGRFQQLAKLGDTEIEMSNIFNATTKEQAAQELLDRNFANGRAEIQALLESVAGKVSAPRKAREVRVKVKKTSVSKKRLSVADRVFGQGPTLSIEEANARAMATVREITPERALELLVHAMPKKRRSRKETV